MWGASENGGLASFGVALDVGTWFALGQVGHDVAVVEYLRPSIVKRWRYTRGTSILLALDGMAGVSARPVQALGPFGFGLTVGVAWPGP
jgi:hypothetical protein